MDTVVAPTKVLVVGCNGRMGKLVCRLIANMDDVEVVAGFDKDITPNFSFPIFNHCSSMRSISKVDVVIDFSSPKCTMHVLKHYTKAFTIPTVIATTDFSDEQLELIKDYSNYFPIFKSVNMSYGVYVIQKALELIVPLLFEYDIEISDVHHSLKRHCPSGTSKMLAKTICNIRNHANKVYARRGVREPNEIGLSSIRGGNVVGTHTIHFLGETDMIEITHTAFSREMFALGAIKAAKLISSKYWYANGLFDMNDLLK